MLVNGVRNRNVRNAFGSIGSNDLKGAAAGWVQPPARGWLTRSGLVRAVSSAAPAIGTALAQPGDVDLYAHGPTQSSSGRKHAMVLVRISMGAERISGVAVRCSLAAIHGSAP